MRVWAKIVCAGVAGCVALPCWAQTTKYRLADSDILVNFGGGKMIDAEVFLTEDQVGKVVDVTLEGYMYNSAIDPIPAVIRVGPDSLEEWSGSLAFDDARDPQLSAVLDGARLTRVFTSGAAHRIEWEPTQQRVTFTIDAGLGDALAGEGLFCATTPNADAALAMVLMSVFADVQGTPVGHSQCWENAVEACSDDCNGEDKNCIKTFEYTNDSNGSVSCSFTCKTHAECCGS